MNAYNYFDHMLLILTFVVEYPAYTANNYVVPAIHRRGFLNRLKSMFQYNMLPYEIQPHEGFTACVQHNLLIKVHQSDAIYIMSGLGVEILRLAKEESLEVARKYFISQKVLKELMLEEEA